MSGWLNDRYRVEERLFEKQDRTLYPGVRQLKIHKSSKSGLVAAFFVSSP